ncbi:Methyltransferase domain-containing protein [Natronorubrum sediminis]|uniref:Methyltransferase domain-containing protein n=1 Tax=Natronorubrum sediminis TaxID=640943 RepID=A0A1H6G1M2_9EURY|nr:class I SAM-dependent methyltransferase [Natronorubrum sediminis]SEH15894.1 Methyltransferase domain-containing protein [Natronorubrum sediminis]
MDDQDVIDYFTSHLSSTDYTASATSQSLEQVAPLVSSLAKHRGEINTILELGVGYGGLSGALADILNCSSVHGIDVDKERLKVAEKRGVETYNLDLESDPYPFKDGEVDLVLSFGVFEHLRYFDHPLEESYRILSQDGHMLHSVPNLASWVNRVALLFGKQPRDVEISRNRAFGISEFYSDTDFLNHVHSPTHDAFLELLDYHGFSVDEVTGIYPYQNKWYVELVDRITSFRPSLSRRIIVLGAKKNP